MKRVMVVEDAEGVRRALVRLGRAQQWDMLEARDGADALELLGGEGPKPDLILLDYSMPRMDGLTLLRHLADGACGPDARAVLYTADSSPTVHRRARDLGARDVIVKASLDWPELAARLERCMATPTDEPPRPQRSSGEETCSSPSRTPDTFSLVVAA